jgi:Zn ribbon nucleic-acid-binding protein
VAKKPEKQTPETPETPEAAVTAPMLPAIIGATAKELEANLIPAVSNLLGAMPPDLACLLQKRFIAPTLNPQPLLPGMGDRKGIDVSWIKVLNPQTQNKTFRGKRLHDGTVLGKSVFFVPGESENPFPFIVLGGWEERQLGGWDTKKNSMDTKCQSRDGLSPAMKNAWGAVECVKCKHDTRNRPKYEKETEYDQKNSRCKKKMNLIGIGGDFEDLYILQIGGKAIVDFYSKTIKKQLLEASSMGLPWYARTFMLSTVEDGTYWTWQLEDVVDTFVAPGYPDTGSTFWSGLSPSQSELVLQTLKVLQLLANKYITERQDAARQALAIHQETGERVELAPDEDTPAGDTVGIN